MERHKFAFLFTSILGALATLVVGGIFFLSGAAAAGSPPVSPGQAPTGGDSCGLWWGSEPAPDPGSSYDTRLYTMSALSANDIWAVGEQSNPVNGARMGYAVHWNGTTWNPVPVPTIAQYPNSTLNGVAAISSNNVWVAGNACTQISCNTFLLRWDGSAFSVIPSPNVPSASNSLADIAAISANDVWAVGRSRSASYVSQPLTLHWDGTAWSIVATPDLGQSAFLTTVAAASGNDVWAMGNYNDSAGRTTYSFALHWNGTAWSAVSMPQPSNYVEITVSGAAAISSNDVWAVGNYRDLSSLDIRTLTFHWDGTAWSLVPSPSMTDDGQGNYVNDISALASNDVWAVGYLADNGSYDPLFLHWDGSAWTMPFVPYSHDDDGLGGVIMISPTDSWAVGYEVHSNGPNPYERPFIQRYTQRCFTSTPTALPTNTATSTRTSTPTFTPTPEPPRCPGERFTDVCPGDYFYQHVLDLANLGAISGYSTAPPCEDGPHIPCFKPYNSSTRGQISKVVSLAAGFGEPVSAQQFEDVMPGSAFYTYTERMASRGIISGYPCGDAPDVCVPPLNRPYFHPERNVTRGQLSKMAVGAFGFNEPVSGQQFEDIAPGSPFYTYTERLSGRGVIIGYPCAGIPQEPCMPPLNRPYFRPGSDVTRGQTAKIVNLARTQPSATATPISTATTTATIPATTTTIATQTASPATATPTATPSNPACQGIRPSVNMLITPGNCEPAGTHFSFTGSAFQPGENVNVYVTAPDGSVFGAPFQLQADANGNTGPVQFNTATSFPIGEWTITMEGVVSHRQALGYFRLTP